MYESGIYGHFLWFCGTLKFYEYTGWLVLGAHPCYHSKVKNIQRILFIFDTTIGLSRSMNHVHCRVSMFILKDSVVHWYFVNTVTGCSLGPSLVTTQQYTICNGSCSYLGPPLALSKSLNPTDYGISMVISMILWDWNFANRAWCFEF